METRARSMPCVETSFPKRYTSREKEKKVNCRGWLEDGIRLSSSGSQLRSGLQDDIQYDLALY